MKKIIIPTKNNDSDKIHLSEVNPSTDIVVYRNPKTNRWSIILDDGYGNENLIDIEVGVEVIIDQHDFNSSEFAEFIHDNAIIDAYCFENAKKAFKFWVSKL